jgi:hypothetical protein
MLFTGFSSQSPAQTRQDLKKYGRPQRPEGNDIAAAKSLTRVRELQAAGLLGPDLPTNVYFFFEVQAPVSQP